VRSTLAGPSRPDGVGTLNRFELKYLVPVGEIGAIRDQLRARLAYDPHGTGGTYTLSSLYFDSPDLACYWAKVDGVRLRRKVRIRHYEGAAALTPETAVFVEIKQRAGRTTQKRRLRLPYEDAQRLCVGDRPDLDLDDPRVAAVAAEVQDLGRRFSLRPTAVTSYRREAWVGGWMDPGVRVTFDTDLRSRTSQLSLEQRHLGRPMVPPTAAVVEIKVNDLVPRWLSLLIGRLDLHSTTFSKYCAAVEGSPLLRPETVAPLRIHRLAPAGAPTP
jgi:hypothetical protein